MRRGGVIWTGILMMVLAVLTALAPARAQVGFDRLGGEYTDFPVHSGDPAQCAARCKGARRCPGLGLLLSGNQNALAICWLKSRVPPRVASGCCVSGVRGAGVIEPRSDPIEFGIDRVGGDYRNLELPADPSGKSCAAACTGEAQCRAWTYARPGYVGPAATCFLKDRVTSPLHRPCCISGVVR